MIQEFTKSLLDWTDAFFIAIGKPSFKSERNIFPFQRKNQEKRIPVPSDSRFRYRKPTQSKKLAAWEITVARAAPAAPKFSRRTNRMSSATLATAAMLIKMNGCRESPKPRSTALTML